MWMYIVVMIDVSKLSSMKDRFHDQHHPNQ
jgi:hypothetical protein